jgi:hypothetical protein
MNAHTPLRLTAALDLDEAMNSLSKIGDLADALVLIANQMMGEGDTMHSNVVGTLAGAIHELAQDGQAALKVG